jgi:hypothetical protein
MTATPKPADVIAAAAASVADLASAQVFLDAVRTKSPLLARRRDADLLGLAVQVATLAHIGASADVWRLGAALEIPDHDWTVLVREAVVTLFPMALTPDYLPEHDA